MSQPTDLPCPRCGACMANVSQHMNWHEEQDAILDRLAHTLGTVATIVEEFTGAGGVEDMVDVPTGEHL
jgi:hypothetical protein